METRASYFFVGLFVLVLIAGAFGFAMWLTRASLQDDNVYYYIYFKGTVSGLQNGSGVQLRGVPIGNVTDIAIDEENIEEVQVTVALKPNAPIKTDTIAQLQLQGITGLSFIQLFGGSRTAPKLEPRPGKRRAVIPSVPSPLERLFENVPEVTGQIIALVAHANELLSEDNLRMISGILSYLDVVLASAAGSSGEFGKLTQDAGKVMQDASGALASMRDTARSLDTLVVQLRGQSTQLGGDAQRMIGRAEETARMFTAAADEFRRLAAENRTNVRDFGETGLFELTQFLIESRALVTTLQRLAAQIERDPARFLFGDQTRGVEAR